VPTRILPRWFPVFSAIRKEKTASAPKSKPPSARRIGCGGWMISDPAAAGL
jgi:hypothetical protein